MKRKEGVYLIKIVDKLPRKLNGNYLYTIEGENFSRFFEYDNLEGQKEINVSAGASSTSVTAGSGVNLTGSGTFSDPYVLSTTASTPAASAVVVTPSGNLTSTDLQSALQELQSDIDAVDGSETSVTAGANIVVTGMGTAGNPFVISAPATVSADGSVTTHSDVTDAGSGQIIIAAERASLTNIHPDDDVESVTGTAVDNTDPRNPVINATDLSAYRTAAAEDTINATKADQTALAQEITDRTNADLLKVNISDKAVQADIDAGTADKWIDAKELREELDNLSRTFVGLTDTPNDLTGLALQILRVNAAETALEAVQLAAGIVSFDNTTATITGNPTTTQAAIEALKALIDAQPILTSVANFAALPDPTTVQNGAIVHAIDASDDPTVTTGWAKYQEIGDTWFKYLAQEDLSVTALTDPQVLDDAGVITGTVTGKQVNDAVKAYIIDEDNMVSDSDTQLPTQQSVKAYVDANDHPDDDVETVTGTAVDNTDPRNPIINSSPELTQVQAEDRTDTTFALTSGERLEQSRIVNTRFVEITAANTQLEVGKSYFIDNQVGTAILPTVGLTVGDYVEIKNSNAVTQSYAMLVTGLVSSPTSNATLPSVVVPTQTTLKFIWNGAAWQIGAGIPSLINLTDAESGLVLSQFHRYVITSTAAGTEFFMPERAFGKIEIRLNTDSTEGITIKQSAATVTDNLSLEDQTVVNNFEISLSRRGQLVDIEGNGNFVNPIWNVFRPWEIDAINNNSTPWQPNTAYNQNDIVSQNRLSDGQLFLYSANIARPNNIPTWDATEEANWTEIGSVPENLEILQSIDVTVTGYFTSFTVANNLVLVDSSGADYSSNDWEIIGDSEATIASGTTLTGVSFNPTINGSRTITIKFKGSSTRRGLSAVKINLRTDAASTGITKIEAKYFSGNTQLFTNGGPAQGAPETYNLPIAFDFLTDPQPQSVEIQDYYQVNGGTFDFAALDTPDGISIAITNISAASSASIIIDNTKPTDVKTHGNVGFGTFPAGTVPSIALAENEHGLFMKDATRTYVTIFPVNGDRVFVDETTLSPTIAGSPTAAEISVHAGNFGLRDKILVYNGTDVDGGEPTYTYVFYVDQGQLTTIFRQPTTGGINWSATNIAGVLFTENQGSILTEGANGTVTLPDITTVNIGHTVAFIGGDAFTYTIQPFAGDQVNDVADAQRFLEKDQKIFYVKKSATSWNATVENVVSENEVLLDAQNIASGGTLTLPANLSSYEYVRFETDDVNFGGVLHAMSESVSVPNISSTRVEIYSSNAAFIRFNMDATGTIANLVTGGGWGSGNWRAIGVRNKDYIPAGTLIAEEADVTLIDVDAATNTFYTFSTGETWAQIKANYEYLLINGNTSQSGLANVRPYSMVIKPENVDLLYSNAGSLYQLDNNHNGVEVSINAPTDTDLGLTFVAGTADAPLNGRMQFTVIGVKKRFNAIRAEDLSVDDQSASNYIDFGNMRMQWGLVTDNNFTTVNLPVPFANNTYNVVASADSGTNAPADTSAARAAHIGSKTTTTFDMRIVFANSSTTGSSSINMSWQAIGLKP